ncbi:type II toxin-antitoxin system RelE/ParE family toxin [Snodgrassella communis]|uniref:type II toxin-antitoxin system RelE/ParE family toxin n=1 Tax=Snodgrassella communis TaxID=2946699 RepID=UPI001EF4A285|nr:type II toxin-antitoxin system RelE/ParE family toxin [Snodgrassella communis]
MSIVWTPEAVHDRTAIYHYIDAENPLAAIRIDSSFSKKIKALLEHPNIGKPGRVTGTRELVVHSNYVVIYDIAGTQIRILRILHTAQKWP